MSDESVLWDVDVRLVFLTPTADPHYMFASPAPTLRKYTPHQVSSPYRLSSVADRYRRRSLFHRDRPLHRRCTQSYPSFDALADPDDTQIEHGPNPSILSTYVDATKTYEMTWHIRNQSEDMTKRQLAKYGKAI